MHQQGKTLRNERSPRRKRAVARGEAGAGERRRVPARNLRAIELLKSWIEDESGYDEDTWPVVKKAMEENRMSYRRLFRD